MFKKIHNFISDKLSLFKPYTPPKLERFDKFNKLKVSSKKEYVYIKTFKRQREKDYEFVRKESAFTYHYKKPTGYHYIEIETIVPLTENGRNFMEELFRDVIISVKEKFFNNGYYWCITLCDHSDFFYLELSEEDVFEIYHSIEPNLLDLFIVDAHMYILVKEIDINTFSKLSQLPEKLDDEFHTINMEYYAFNPEQVIKKFKEVHDGHGSLAFEIEKGVSFNFTYKWEFGYQGLKISINPSIKYKVFDFVVNELKARGFEVETSVFEE